jgi:TonB family protein
MMNRAIAIVIVTAGWGCAMSAHAQEQPTPDVPKVIRKSGGVLQASATRRVEPAYPPLAKAAHISGSVVVELTIDETGDVVRAQVISGHPLLKDAAVEAALGWKFQPTMLQGVPVKVVGTITFNFSLGSDEGLSIEAAEKAVQEHPDSAQAHYDLAVALYRRGRRPEAIQALKDAIGINPSLQAAYRSLGVYLLASGPENEAEAIDSLRQAVRLNPRDFEAQLTLGSVYSRTHRYDEAIELYQEALKQNPSLGSMYMELGRVYAEMGNYDRAEDAYKQALKNQPSFVGGYLSLGNLYIKLGRTTEAIEMLRQATTLAPRYDGGHFALGMAYAKSGDKKSAMEEYDALKGLGSQLADELLKEMNK